MTTFTKESQNKKILSQELSPHSHVSFSVLPWQNLWLNPFAMGFLFFAIKCPVTEGKFPTNVLNNVLDYITDMARPIGQGKRS